MRVYVKKTFKDKHNPKIVYGAGTYIEVTPERADEILKSGPYIQKPEKAKDKKKGGSKDPDKELEEMEG